MSSVWESVQLARHAKRPLFMDYANQLFSEFDILHGDRAYADDKAIIGGLARLDNRPVMLIGQHRGRSTRERIAHNFGMANPEGYRKVIRLVRMAERFNIPVLTFIDTQGAYPGVGADASQKFSSAIKSLADTNAIASGVDATICNDSLLYV